jgi:hypothetical protein
MSTTLLAGLVLSPNVTRRTQSSRRGGRVGIGAWILGAKPALRSPGIRSPWRYFDENLAGNDSRSSDDLRSAASFSNDQRRLSRDDRFIDVGGALDNDAIGSH